MALCKVCRLCSNICSDYVRLFDTNGQCTEIYQITSNFFPPTFLDLDHDERNHLAVLCLECWHHISGFHNFQQTVLLVRAKLLQQAEEAKGNPIDGVKEEEEFLSLSEVELANTHSKSQLIFTERALQFEENIDSLLSQGIHSDVKVSTDVISVTDSTEDQLWEEFEEPVGVFVGGEFNENENMSIPSSQSKSKRKRGQNIDDIIAEWKPILECEVCREPCSTFTALGYHFSEKHPNDVCHIVCCQRKFKFPCRIKEHIRIHLDPEAYKCDLCTRCLSTKSALNNHMFHIHRIDSRYSFRRDYENQRAKYKHKCHICGKAYKVPSALREHMSKHTGEPSHVCSYCPKTFSYRSSLCNHLADAHPEQAKKSQKK